MVDVDVAFGLGSESESGKDGLGLMSGIARKQPA